MVIVPYIILGLSVCKAAREERNEEKKFTIPNSNPAEKVALTLGFFHLQCYAQELALLAFIQSPDVVSNVLLNIDFIARSLVASNESREQAALMKVTAKCGGLAPQRS